MTPPLTPPAPEPSPAPQQARAQKTRERLMTVAENIVSTKGYEALRVEEVVAQAGVAKGTFFAHFTDKDGLMERLLGARLERILDQIDTAPTPQTVDQLVDRLMPILGLLASERMVFDVIFRHSGAAASDAIGPIALALARFEMVVGGWLDAPGFRRDVPAEVLAEGIGALITQTIALDFCALKSAQPARARLSRYLHAWLAPQNHG